MLHYQHSIGEDLKTQNNWKIKQHGSLLILSIPSWGAPAMRWGQQITQFTWEKSNQFPASTKPYIFSGTLKTYFGHRRELGLGVIINICIYTLYFHIKLWTQRGTPICMVKLI